MNNSKRQAEMLTNAEILSPSSYRIWKFREVAGGPQRWLFILTAAALIYLVVPPVLFILWTSFVPDLGAGAANFTFEHYRAIFGSVAEFETLLWNSLIFCAGSAVGALTLGTTVAWLAERTNAPFRGLA